MLSIGWWYFLARACSGVGTSAVCLCLGGLGPVPEFVTLGLNAGLGRPWRHR